MVPFFTVDRVELKGGKPVALSELDKLDLTLEEISDEDLMAQLDAIVGDSDEDGDAAPNPLWEPSYKGMRQTRLGCLCSFVYL